MKATVLLFFTMTLLCNKVIYSAEALTWNKALERDFLYLYAGNIYDEDNIETLISLYPQAIGLSLITNDAYHIQHDITQPIPLPKNVVSIYQSEDVFEHIEYEKLIPIIDEIYRVLKPNGLLRISIPDYQCNILYNRSLKNEKGEVIFDRHGGGKYINGKITNGGHVWFPTYDKVKKLLDQTKFKRNGTITYLHYYNTRGNSITNPIDYSKGYIKRTPDHDRRVQKPYRAMSMVIDLIKLPKS